MRVSSRGRPTRLLRLLGAAGVLVVSLTGCDVARFGFPSGITVQSARVLRLWQGSAIAALAVGVFVWALIFWACFAYRKRGDHLPQQVRYNLPIEVLYTAIPFVIIGALFYYTAIDEVYVDKLSANPDLKVGVEGFQWNWQFQYIAGKDVPPPQNNQLITITGGTGNEQPTLVLPIGETIHFYESSPDVIHSFWVPEFLFKRDVIPGRTNQFEVTIDRTGTFVGHCAEFCGTNHDNMNFYVKAVSQADFKTFISQQQRQLAAAGASTGPTG